MSRPVEEGQMMPGGHCRHTAAVRVEGGNCPREATAEKVEVGRSVIVRLESQARKEAVGMIELAWLFSRRKSKDYQMSYLVEGRYGFQEVHWEVLHDQVSLQYMCISS